MLRRFLILLLFLTWLSSCIHEQNSSVIRNESGSIASNFETSKTLSNRSLIGNKNLKKIILLKSESPRLKVQDFLKKFEYVVLETTKASTFGYISKILIKQQKIIILDSRISKGVYVFSLTGKFLYKIDHTKNCDQPDDIGVVKNRLMILEGSRNLLTFNLSSGKAINEVKLPFFAANFSENNSESNNYDFYTLHKSQIGDNYDYWIINVDLLRHKINFRDFKKTKLDFPPLFSFLMFNDKSFTLFRKNHNDTIFKIDKNKIIPEYYFDFSGKNMPKGYLSKLRETPNINVIEKTFDSKYVSGISDFLLNDKWGYISYIYERTKHHAYFNRLNNQTIETKIVIDDLFLGALSKSPIGVYDSLFVYQIDAEKLSINQSKSNNKGNYLALEISRKIDRKSNPIIVFATP